MDKINKIGYGTAAIGRPAYINIRKQKANDFLMPAFKKDGLQVLEAAYNNGIRFFDTSPGYGMAEELLLDWLNDKKDPSISVSTKWGYTYVANFDPNATVHEVKEHSIAKLNEQWEFSKKLLPYLNVYQIHSATLETGVLNNMEVLKKLHQLKKEHGLVIGLTTTGVNQVEVINKALEVRVENEPLFQSLQCTFNILDQSVLVLKEKLIKANIELIAKETLANGRLLPNKSFPKYKKLYSYLLLLAVKYSVGVDAIALRYCMAVFPEATILTGASCKIHLENNLKVTQFSLNKLELNELSKFGIKSSDYWLERGRLDWN